MIGDTVKLVNDKTYLTLCEVRVWGPREPIIEDVADHDEVGDMSAASDDAVSIAACPAGEVPVFYFLCFDHE